MANKQLPTSGENVSVEILNVDELEVTCWITGYSVMSYMDNVNMKFALSDIGKKNVRQVKCVDRDTGRIELFNF
jgi:hypothetical protein